MVVGQPRSIIRSIFQYSLANSIRIKFNKYTNILGGYKTESTKLYCKFICQCLKETFKREVWNYKRCDFNLLNNALMNAPWNVLDIYDDIDDALDYFMHLFNKIVKEHVPNYTVKIRHKD